MKKVSLSLIAYIICSQNLFAQINIDDSLIARLYKTEKFNNKSFVSTPWTPPSGPMIARAAEEFLYHDANNNVSTYYEIRKIDYSIDGGDIIPMPSQGATQSEQVTSYNYLICNCGSSFTTSPSYQVAWKNSQTITLTNTLSSQKTTNYSIKMGTKVDYGAWGGTTDVTFGQTFVTSTTNTEQNQNSKESDENWNQQFTFNVKENTAKIIKIDFTLKTAKIPFVANLYINGTVALTNVEKTEIVRNGVILKTSLRDLGSETIQLKKILADSLRWFQLKGFLEFSHANKSDVTVQVADQSLPETSENCTIQQKKLQEQIKDLNSRESKLMNVIFKQR